MEEVTISPEESWRQLLSDEYPAPALAPPLQMMSRPKTCLELQNLNQPAAADSAPKPHPADPPSPDPAPPPSQEKDKNQFRDDYMYATGMESYYAVRRSATWEQARHTCESEGTMLLVPESIAEIENIKLLLSNLKAFHNVIFIGIHSQFSPGDYVTLEGVPIYNTLLDLMWMENRPGSTNGSENCVVMNREGLLDDVSCDAMYPFLCKIHFNDTKYNDDCKNHDMKYKLNKNKSCYKFHKEPLNWHDAYLTCEAEEAHLAIINSPEEANLVTSFLGENVNSNAPNPDILFLGFSDLMYPFQYRTVFDESLEQVGYVSWSPIKDRPEDMHLMHCGAISRSGFLRITYCERPAMFLCERSPTD